MLEINEELLAIDDAIEQLVEAILASPQVQDYQAKQVSLMADQDLQDQLAQFQELQASYEDQKEFAKYRPEVSQLRRQILRLKREIDMTQTMQDFRLAEVTLQSLLAEITRQLAESVSSDIFVDTGLPLAPRRHKHGQGRGENIREDAQE